MTRMPVFLPFLLTFVASAAAADLREVDQKILEYNAGQAREALGRGGLSEPQKLAAEGRILGLEKKYSEAEAKLRKATELRADDAATWNFQGIAQDVAALHRMGRELANSGAWPNYRATSEFRAIRDASAARRP